MFSRDLEVKARELATQFPVVALLGPRQSGKTTFARSVFSKHAYLSLENPDIREFALSDPRGFLQSIENSHGVILDEVQHLPHLLSYIQTEVDQHESTGKFILTGSQNFVLNEKITQSLAGRVALLTLLPLSIKELREGGKLPPSYEPLIFQGGYPRVHAKAISASDWYRNYIHTYVEKDIRQIKNVTDLISFQRFIKLCAGRIGQLINWSDLGRDCGISYNTAKAWASLLEACYIIFFLPPYHENFNKRVIKSPKLYFYDTGLACSLLNIEVEKQIEGHYLRGELFESFIISEFLKQRFNQGLSPQLFFWRDKLGHEVDCLLQSSERVISIEIKSGKTISQDFFRDLVYWQKLSNSPSLDSYLIYGGQESQKRTSGNVVGWERTGDISTGIVDSA